MAVKDSARELRRGHGSPTFGVLHENRFVGMPRHSRRPGGIGPEAATEVIMKVMMVPPVSGIARRLLGPPADPSIEVSL